MICDICRDGIEANVPKSVWGEELGTLVIWDHHLTCSSLKASVEAGCYICNRIWICLATEHQTYIIGLTKQAQALGVDKLSLENGKSAHDSNAVTQMQLWWHLDNRYENFETMTASINLQRTYPSSTLATKYQWSNIGDFLIHPYNGNFKPTYPYG